MNLSFEREMTDPSIEAQTDAPGSKAGDNETDKSGGYSAEKETSIQNLGHQGVEQLGPQKVIQGKKDRDDGNKNSQGKTCADVQVKQKNGFCRGVTFDVNHLLFYIKTKYPRQF